MPRGEPGAPVLVSTCRRGGHVCGWSRVDVRGAARRARPLLRARPSPRVHGSPADRGDAPRGRRGRARPVMRADLCVARQGDSCAVRSAPAPGHSGPVPLRAKSDLPRCGRGAGGRGALVRIAAACGIRRPLLARGPSLRRVVRGAHAPADVRSRVRSVLPSRAAVVAAPQPFVITVRSRAKRPAPRGRWAPQVEREAAPRVTAAAELARQTAAG